jgi:hypothetical protein
MLKTWRGGGYRCCWCSANANRLASVVIVVLLTSCSRESPRKLDPGKARVGDLPRLEEVSFAIQDQDLPLDAPEGLAVTVHGEVSYTFSPSDVPLFRTVDSQGAGIARWGKIGSGPGEVREALGLVPLDTQVAFLDPARKQAVVFSVTGKVVTESRGVIDYLPIAADDRGAVLNVRFVNRTGSWIEWRPFAAGQAPRILVPAVDSFLRRIAQLSKKSGNWPIAAWDGRRLVLSDGYSYELGEYEANHQRKVFSRAMPPRTRTAWELDEYQDVLTRRARPVMGPNGTLLPGLKYDSLSRRAALDTLPRLRPGSMGFDERGRLWVVGREGDSTFADAYADTTYLGRRMIGCRDAQPTRRTVSIRGHWLVLACQQGDEEHPFALRLFRIIEN